MDTVEFFKTVNRICKNRGCNVCPAGKEETCMVGFDNDSIKSIEETVSKVEQWAKYHPIKTRQSEFLKMFPHAQKRDGIINICPLSVDKDHKTNSECRKTNCGGCRQRFWNEEVSE